MSEELDIYNCAKCGKQIEKKAVVLDDAEYYHAECAAKMLKYRCPRCGYMYTEKPEDAICDAFERASFCGGTVKYIRSAKKRLNIMRRWAFELYEKPPKKEMLF